MTDHEDFLDYILGNGPNSNNLPGHVFVTDFEDRDLQVFTEQMINAAQDSKIKEIFIWVSSYGGQTYNAFAMVDMVKSIKKPIYTIAYGKAMSSGCLLLAAGNVGKRYATPNSYVMFHTVSSGAEGKSADVLQEALETERINQEFIKLFAQLVKKRPDTIRKIMKERLNTDLNMSAQQAKEFGVIDHIGMPKAVFKVSEPEERLKNQRVIPLMDISMLTSRNEED